MIIFCVLYLCTNSKAQTYVFGCDTTYNKNSMIINEYIYMLDSSNTSYYGSTIQFSKHIDHNNKLIKSTASSGAWGKLAIERTHYSNGNMKCIEVFQWAQQVGPYYEFYEDGKLKTFGMYTFLSSVSELNMALDTVQNENADSIFMNYTPIKHGEWLFCDEEGYLINKEIWQSNTLLNTSFYSKSSKIKIIFH
jgi:hypothetical protein